MIPARDGLPAIEGYRGKTGEDVLLFLGIETATNMIRHGRPITADAYNSYQALIRRVKALDDALNHRVRMTGGEDD